MVFISRCFSFGDVKEDETRARANTSVENFYTANSDFDVRRPGSTPGPGHQNFDIRASSNLRLFTFAELETATRNFDAALKIGEGGFGSVYRGVIKSLDYPYNEINVAVKRGKRGLKDRQSQKGHKQWVTEVNFLGKVEHPNLVKLVGYCYEDHANEIHRLLVYEYMPNKSLDDHLSAKSNTPLSWAMRLSIAQDAARGLAYLHEDLRPQIIFRDFKPSNILLDSQWKAKLSDFGFAREGPPEGRTHVSTMVSGTKGYAAPEYVQTGRLTFKNDVWSYGIFLEELIMGRRPPAQNNPENTHGCFGWLKCCYSGQQKSKLIVDSRLDQGTYSQRSVRKLSLIANKCLAKEPRSRPMMSDVLQMVNEVINLETRAR